MNFYNSMTPVGYNLNEAAGVCLNRIKGSSVKPLSEKQIQKAKDAEVIVFRARKPSSVLKKNMGVSQAQMILDAKSRAGK